MKIPRADSCGRADGRLCESLIGNITADSMRTTYGTDFAITNAGGLRADLTCPYPDIPGDFCPAFTPSPYLITRGQDLAVLPFGNLVFTVSITGAELKTFLENGVSSMPAANGRFPQISGLCFIYDISAPVGSRVTSVVYQAADGSCTGAPVDLTESSFYTIAENDFMATGGDGYPNVYARGTIQNYMDQVLADYIFANTPVNPAIQGRIACTTSGSTACPLRTVTLAFNVTVPASTDGTGHSVNIAGSLDQLDGGLPSWNPGGVVLARIDATHWTITLTGKEGTQIEYKYTLGDWAHVEKDGSCGEIGNRQLTLSYGATGTQNINDTVLNWRNVAPCGD